MSKCLLEITSETENALGDRSVGLWLDPVMALVMKREVCEGGFCIFDFGFREVGEDFAFAGGTGSQHNLDSLSGLCFWEVCRVEVRCTSAFFQVKMPMVDGDLAGNL